MTISKTILRGCEYGGEGRSEDGHRRRSVFFSPIYERALTGYSVGAGAGGVATAARLARAGFQVTVFEKNAFTGGRCSLIHHEGYVCRPPLPTIALADHGISALIKVHRYFYYQDFSMRPLQISVLHSEQKGWS